MIKGASSNEMARMIGRKLLVHTKYADKSALNENLISEESRSAKAASQSRSRERKSLSKENRQAAIKNKNSS